jgi:hypothetical protein
VRFRWKVGVNSYVEVYEHRLVAGCVGGDEAHHRNGVRADNCPENLVVVTKSQHALLHAADRRPTRRAGREPTTRRQKFDLTDAIALYNQGLSTVQIGREYGVHPSNVSRRLRAAGIELRKEAHNRVELDCSVVRAMFEAGAGAATIGAAFGVSAVPVTRVLKAIGLRRPAGRVRRRMQGLSPAQTRMSGREKF